MTGLALLGEFSVALAVCSTTYVPVALLIPLFGLMGYGCCVLTGSNVRRFQLGARWLEILCCGPPVFGLTLLCHVHMCSCSMLLTGYCSVDVSCHICNFAGLGHYTICVVRKL